MRPLDGITVVSFEHAVAAPFCTRQLADLGARVIKVERPGTGDFARHYDTRANGLSSHFVWTNRSKESLTLDLKHALSTEVLDALLAKADVVVQNLAPGAARRLGISYQELSNRHPQLILCNISGYGTDGPDKDRKAYDLLIQAEAGFMSITGTDEHPVKAGISVADIAAGMYAYSSILAALIERGKTGKGREIDISMLEAMAEWMGYPMYYAMDNAPPPPRAGGGHATINPYGPFRTADGKTVILGVQNDREWRVFCNYVLQATNLADDPQYNTNAQRSQNKSQLEELINRAFSALTAAQIKDRLNNAKIANAEMNTLADLWAHPQLKARDRWSSVSTECGTLPTLHPPGQTNARMEPVPALGQHSEQLLIELGFASDFINIMKKDGAI